MSSLDIINAKNDKVGLVALDPKLMSEKINKAVLYQAVRAHLAGKHHGTVDTKTRAEVLRTGKKVFKQKGTGNARHGSMKSSPFVGGGRVFGPHQRDYAQKVNKKVKILAIREALRYQIAGKNLTVVDSIPVKAAKTKPALEFFNKIQIQKGLVVIEAGQTIVEKSIRNLKGFKVITPEQVNVFDLVKYAKVVVTAPVFESLKKKYLTVE